MADSPSYEPSDTRHPSRLRLLIVSYSDFSGGADRAIARIQSALVQFEEDIGVSSTLRVIRSDGKTPKVVSGFPERSAKLTFLGNAMMVVEALHKRVFSLLGGRGFSSSAHIATGLGAEINSSDADIVLLNWIGDRTVSLEELSEVRKPIVLRNADMWFLLPLAHYPRFKHEKSLRGFFIKLLDYLFFYRREENRGAVKKNFLRTTVSGTVSPSEWLYELSRADECLVGKEHAVIPNPIDADFWFPVSKSEARQRLGIPDNAFSIGFGAVGGLRDPRKGGHALLEAVKFLNQQSPSKSKKIRVDIFGQVAPRTKRGMKSVIFHGVLSSEQLRDFYSAVDIFVALPTIEGFPNTVAEAASCGTPAVATDIPGMRDIIEPDRTGLLVATADVLDLVAKLGFVVGDERWLRKASRLARERSKVLWSSQAVAIQYADFLWKVSAPSGRPSPN